MSQFWRYLRVYKFRSILATNFLYSLLIIFLPILAVNYLLYAFFTESVISEVKTAHIRSLTQMVSKMDTMFTGIDNLKNMLAKEKLILNFLEKDSAYDYNHIKHVNEINEIINNYMLIFGEIYSIRLYASNSDYVIDTRYGSGDGSLFTEGYWQRFLDMYYLDANTMHQQEVVRDERTNTLFLPVHKVLLSDEISVGILLINVSLSAVNKAFDIDSVGSRAIFFYKDQVIFDSGEASLPAGYEFNKSFTDTFYSGETVYIISSLQSSYNQISYVIAEPLDEFSGKANMVQRFYMIILIFEIILILFVSALISFRTYRPIKEIMNLIDGEDRTDERGHIEKTEEKSEADRKTGEKISELVYITSQISDTKSKATHMEGELLRKGELLNRAQAIALQSQINPHFLFNTLDNIKWKVMELTEGDNVASEMIESLAMLLRMSLETEQHIVSFEDEIYHCKLYIDLLNKRYEGVFNVEWQVDPELCEYKTIRLLLQPIVENAIYHGIKPRGRGHICISLRQENDCVLLEVRDDGVGIDANRLKQVNDRLKLEAIKENKHIGLSNVNHRVKITFGEGYGMKVKSTVGAGTSVLILLPKVK